METPPSTDLPPSNLPSTRGYQLELLEESLTNNLIIALDTGSGKTHIAVLRMKIEAEREANKVSWFLAPTVALCEQQSSVISQALPVSVGLISGALEPDQWKDPALWRAVLEKHRIMVTTPQVLLDGLRHGYIHLGQDIGLIVFDEAHHAIDKHPYNLIMKEFYFPLRSRHRTSGYFVRPLILGLTASPIYGGNVQSAFRTIEANLDSMIRTTRHHLDELATFVHRPVFKHVQYSPSYVCTSQNVAELSSVIATIDIEDDPYVQSLRDELYKLPYGPDRMRVDQKLSKTLLKANTYTHKGLNDFYRTASEIGADVGPWAADWYVAMVLEQAKAAATPYHNIISVWQHKEKKYLLDILDRVKAIPPSYQPEAIVKGISHKMTVLVGCLEMEKASSEEHDEDYSGIIFVTRRDTVLAIAEILAHHPRTSKIFRAGCLLGTSENANRRSFLDITRKILPQTQGEILLDFKVGEKNLLVSTAVAEEGIDIQACGSVIRWDIPQNMISWAQSRGRARRQRSTFILMFDDDQVHSGLILKWERQEKEMQATYNDSRLAKRSSLDDSEEWSGIDDDEYLKFCVESTGALLTLDSAVAHLNHFCSVLPNTSHTMNIPTYQIDPPDLPEEWHSMEYPRTNAMPYQGPWGSTVTLPRQVPPGLRVFCTDREHPTKRSAHRHAAFKAYCALYKAGLLNDNLLPLTSVIEPDLEEEVKALLKGVGKRSGTANVTGQMDPWAPTNKADIWGCSEVVIDGLPPLHMITRSRPTELSETECPTLYHPRRGHLRVAIRGISSGNLSTTKITKAQEFTRRILWEIYGSRMRWDDLHFAYLFAPANDVHETAEWAARRSWLDDINAREGRADREAANAEAFGNCFSFPNDLTIVRENGRTANFRFIRWRFEAVSPEEEKALRERYSFPLDQIIPPFLVVQRFPRRMNFLSVEDAAKSIEREGKYLTETELLLRSRFSTVSLISATDTDYALFLPSIIRHLSMAMTVSSLRTTLLTPSLAAIPMHLLQEAITAPVSQERANYQRLETLGDTVLKFVVSVQLLAGYRFWHEGYLTKKKELTISNKRLAKDAHAKGLYRWIIRDRFLAQKWKPAYLTVAADDNGSEHVEEDSDQQLSTKMLADVVESLIGAAYLHGGFDLGIECAQLFGLNLIWEKHSLRVQQILSCIETTDDFPTQTTYVERMLGYNFKRKLLLIEALTHGSYQFDDRTVSYERMEFLGDSVLDMIVTDYLYHAPGKKYSPGHMHLRRSAVVNTHFLAYICLRCSLVVDTSMPRPNELGSISVQADTQRIYLWQCLLHSSPSILEDFNNTFFHYQKNQADIEAALTTEKVFPWATLTRLRAPKLYSDMTEGLLGAIYLDSNGDLDVVREVLCALGIFQTLERIVIDDVDVLHPVSCLSVWAARKSKEIEYKFEKEKDTITCLILLDGEEAYRVSDAYRGRASQNDVKFAAAEKAVRALHLREEEEHIQDEN